MVFKRLLGSLGVGGPSVDTVLEGGPVVPGGTLHGQVHLEGGSADADIQAVVLELVARVEAEHEDGAYEGFAVFDRMVVGGGFRLFAGRRHSVPFSFHVPWETPVTELHGQPLGIALGVRTELEVAGARDKGDLDPLSVAPLPAQEAILEALGQLGFGFRSADLEVGHVHGTGQMLPFYQEIELTPAPKYSHAVSEIELTFIAGPGGVEIILEADKRGGLFSEGHDQVNRFVISHDSVPHLDWAAEVDSWMHRLIDHHSAFGGDASYVHGGSHGGYGHHGGHGHKDSHHHYEDGHRSGPGMGTAIAAGAAGLAVGAVGGYVAAEVIEEIFDDEGDEGDEGGDEES